MKIPVCFLSALLGLIASSLWITEAAEDEDSEIERIVGGRNAVEGQFPWVVALHRDGSFICTGSIIGITTVVSAAHCVVTDGVTGPASAFYAIANLRRDAPNVLIKFFSVTPHPKYSESNLTNDIAIFKTTEPIPFNETVQQICIPRNDTDRNYEKPIAMGWGSTSPFTLLPRIPIILQYIEQKIVGPFLCSLAYLFNPVEDHKICAGDLRGGICNGDSGGPLVHYNENDTAIMIGVASYGNRFAPCGTLPAVWTRVSSFKDFITEVAGNDSTLCVV